MLVNYLFKQLMGRKAEEVFERLSFIFLPNEVKEITEDSFKRSTINSIKINKKNVEYRFVFYLSNFVKMLNKNKGFTDIHLFEIKNLIKRIL